MDAIRRGSHLLLRNAHGELVQGRALSGIELSGRNTIVWVCRAIDWGDGTLAKEEGIPWPIEALDLDVTEEHATDAASHTGATPVSSADVA